MIARFTQGHAVLIGVGADLPNTVDDATGFANILMDSGRCAYPANQVQLLTGDGATRDKILKALDKLAAETTDEATAIVYFSGHGYRVQSPIGEAYYLMPFGYDITHLYETAVSGDELAAKLKAIPARRLLFLLDCCHAGGLDGSKTAGLSLTKAPLPPQAETLFSQGNGRVVIASSRADELSFAGKPYSAFTLALIEALAGVGVAKKDGYVRVSDLALHTRQMVPQRTKDRQHPIMHFEQADNFVLAYYAGGENEPKTLPFGQEFVIENEGNRIQVGNIENSQAVAVGPGATANVNIYNSYNVSPGATSINNAIVQLTIDSSIEMELELEEYRDLWRQGQRHKAYEWAQHFKKNERWDTLRGESKIKLLCFAASLELDHDHIDAAKQLTKEAKRIASSPIIDKLHAHIAFHENKVERAKTYLEGSNDIGSRNLLAALCMENQDIEGTHQVLFSLPLLDVENSETYRLKALYHLINHNVDRAHAEIMKAVQQQSKWTAIQFVAATVDYFKAIALNGLPKPLWPVPQPVPWVLIKRDEASLMYLEKAGRTFKSLLETHELNELWLFQTGVWYLACLASHPEYHAEANAVCQELVSKDLTQPLYIEWAVVRNYDIDFEASKAALWQLVNEDRATPAHVQALYHLYIMENEPNAIIQLLEKTETLFIETDQHYIWGGLAWLCHFAKRWGYIHTSIYRAIRLLN